MQERINNNGLRWGLIIAFVYCLFLILRYKTGETDILMFSLWTFLGYIVTLILLFISGIVLRKNLGGYIELKEVFKSLFISVLIFEFFYSIFNFIYLKYINPQFFDRFKETMETMLEKSNQPQEKIDSALNKIDTDAVHKMNIFDVLKGYLFWVGISGILSFLMALIIKRKRPFEQPENFLQQ